MKVIGRAGHDWAVAAAECSRPATARIARATVIPLVSQKIIEGTL
jgi:hypothetical protein